MTGPVSPTASLVLLALLPNVVTDVFPHDSQMPHYAGRPSLPEHQTLWLESPPLTEQAFTLVVQISMHSSATHGRPSYVSNCSLLCVRIFQIYP